MQKFGMHDEQGRHLVPKNGLCLALTDLSSNSQGKDYSALRPDINWIVRLQWGYGTTGTIPKTERLDDYLKSVENFLRSSSGIHAVTVGNEPNHEQERPDGMVITPEYYFEVYERVVEIVRRVSPSLLIAPAAYAPYHADPSNWLVQFHQVLSLVSSQKVGCDWINIHAYLRSSHPSAATSDEKMGDYPLTGQYASFRTYRDALNAVPTPLRHLPAFITECNELLPQGWENSNTGVVKAVYREIDYWNGMEGTQKVRGVILYRWPKEDKFFIEGKQGVIDDFAEAIAEGSQNAQEGRSEALDPQVVQSSQKNYKNVPEPSTGFERDLDPRAIARGVDVVYLPASQAGWRVKKIHWLDVKESQGRHHIYYEILNREGKRAVQKDLVRVVWPSGADSIDSELKPGEPYSANFPMSSSRNDFSTWIIDPAFPSEKVTGIGMGADEGSGFNPSAHSSTYIEYYFTEALVQAEIPEKPVEGTVPDLAHPVADPKYRTVTQDFGEHPEDYKKFGIPGHNGVDFGTPMETNIQAVDAGKVILSKFDPEGFGHHVKIKHEWGESLYAHLARPGVLEGKTVVDGDIIGESGNSGYSSGPHLHFGIRPYPLDLTNGYNGYVDPLPYLEGEVEEGGESIREVVTKVAKEYGIDWRFLVSLAWAESSFRPEIQDGLFQIGNAAWSDWSKKGERRENPLDNARVAARYYQWLLNHYRGNEVKALQAWNFGPGNVDEGVAVPAITQEFVNKVRHGRDLLVAIGA